MEGAVHIAHVLEHLVADYRREHSVVEREPVGIRVDQLDTARVLQAGQARAVLELQVASDRVEAHHA
jgi:hypothetical protein